MSLTYYVHADGTFGAATDDVGEDYSPLIEVTDNGLTDVNTQKWDFDNSVWVDIVPTADEIKEEAHRRIREAIPAWMVEREVLGGTAVSTTLKDYAEDVRTASNTLEGTTPANFKDDSHWPTPPS
jgi:hypothetical protein